MNNSIIKLQLWRNYDTWEKAREKTNEKRRTWNFLICEMGEILIKTNFTGLGRKRSAGEKKPIGSECIV